MDPHIHIERCQKEWRKLGYKDDKLLPHLFPTTLGDLQKNGARWKKHGWNLYLERVKRQFDKGLLILPDR